LLISKEDSAQRREERKEDFSHRFSQIYTDVNNKEKDEKQKKMG
jgi:hypothetical protein